MPVQTGDIRPGAYLKDDTGLYRVDGVKRTNMAVQVLLEDALSPLTSERIPDPQVPGRLGRSVPLKPHVRCLALGFVRERFELMRPAPDAEDTASVEEWGEGG